MTRDIHRIVVAGAGLAGHECVSRLLADPSLDAEITWFGAESDRPYNRVLLTDLLAGHHAPDAIGLATLSDPRLTTHYGRAVQRIDRATRRVTVDGGASIPYDKLVLATGADPILPPIRGNALPLRTLSDIRTILQALESGIRRVAVVGAGPLGIQTACALAARGHAQAIELLHDGPHPMHQWLDAEAGRLLAASLRAAGITVRCGTRVSATTGDDWPKADLVVITCGTNPRTALAKSAGLPVDRGVLTGEGSRSIADPDIHAIGDCAQIGVRVAHGLALPAMDQARNAAETILAGHHHTAPPPHRPSPTLLRLRSHGIAGVETAVLVSPTAPNPAVAPALRLTDQHRGTHKALTLSPDDDRVIGATLVGEVAAAAALSRLLTWPEPQPVAPVALLTSPGHADEKTVGSR